MPLNKRFHNDIQYTDWVERSSETIDEKTEEITKHDFIFATLSIMLWIPKKNDTAKVYYTVTPFLPTDASDEYKQAAIKLAAQKLIHDCDLEETKKHKSFVTSKRRLVVNDQYPSSSNK